MHAPHAAFVAKSLTKSDNENVEFTDLFFLNTPESLTKYKKQKH